MKRSVSLACLALIAAFACASPSQAQRGWDQDYRYGGYGRYGNTGGGINSMQAQLQARITSGMNSGRLTPSEASRLQSRLNNINALEARLRSSGNRLSFGERQRLNAQLARLNDRITRELNDYDRRFASRRGGWR